MFCMVDATFYLIVVGIKHEPYLFSFCISIRAHLVFLELKERYQYYFNASTSRPEIRLDI